MVLDGRPASLRPDQRPRPAPTGLPPHDIAAEEAVIAALLLDDDSYPRVLPIVQPEDFFREQNGWVYEACLALAERNEPITIPTVAHVLDRNTRLDAAGGEQYLAEIAGKYFTAVGVEAHARIVARDALYRRLIEVAGRIAQLAYQGGSDVGRVLSEAEGLLLGIRSAEAAGDFKRLRELLDEFLEAPTDEDEGELLPRPEGPGATLRRPPLHLPVRQRRQPLPGPAAERYATVAGPQRTPRCVGSPRAAVHDACPVLRPESPQPSGRCQRL